MISCQAEVPSRKINGISLVASRDSLTQKLLPPILETNANAIALMPYAFVPDKNQPKLYFNVEQQWFGERVEGILIAIKQLKEKKLQLMLKPHIWIRNGEFTGDIEFSTEKEWIEFESAYRDYILTYATIANQYEIEYFCIGTELFNFVDQRPHFWKELISEIRQNYHGQLVYAENWDKVNKTDIWEDLDFIGVDAYFPISDNYSPETKEIELGWEKHKEVLKELSRTYNLQVLFTEYGYRSMDYALKEPWNSSRDSLSMNQDLQARSLKVLYEEFWTEAWFAGGFLWKWHQDPSAGGPGNNQFTPQNKQAEEVIREHFHRFRN